MVSDKWRKAIIIAAVVLTILIILIVVIVGVKGLRQFLIALLIGIMILGILFGLAYIFYLIFIKKEFKDIPATYKKKLHGAARLMRNEMLGTLFLSGDTKHNRVSLGKYKYLRVRLPKQQREMKRDKKGEIEYDKWQRPIETEVTESIPVDVFVVDRRSIVERFLGEPIYIMVKPEDHNYSSIFNDVVINGFNLVPLDSQFYTIDHRSLDVDIIKGVATNYIREVVYEIFRDLDRLVKQAMNLDAPFQKDKEKQLQFEIPQVRQLGGGEQH